MKMSKVGLPMMPVHGQNNTGRESLVKPTSASHSVPTLQELLGNLELLYVKAKNFHWNVHGVNFRSNHLMFDGIQEVALEWADLIAERMRAIGEPVDARSCRFIKDAWFPEVEQSTLDENGMVKDMALTLTCMCEHICDMICSPQFTADPITQNKLQDLGHEIDKQFYFVSSSMPA